MTLAATSAFAPDFTHTSAAPDVVLTFTTGTSPVNVTLATGTYRMCLAPAAGDFLRALESAINAAITGASHVDSSIAITLSAAGVVTLSVVDEEDSELATLTLSTLLAARLGLPTLLDTAGSVWAFVGTRPVWHLALLSSVRHGPWLPRQAGGAEQTAAGRVYAIAATATSWMRSHAVSFQPTHPAQRAAQGADATALLPAPEYMGALGSTATAREWSVLDVLYGCRNAAAGFALGNWQTVRTSTSERFFYGYVGPASLLSPAFTAQDDTWDAWADWTLDVVLPTTGASITRT